MEHGLVSTYADMESRGITVINHKLKKRKSLCSEDGFICLDCSKMETEAEEHTVAIHEDGHFLSNAFYNQYSPYVVREQAEYRANKAAILKHIKWTDIQAQFACGHTELWELAEYFNVTEDFMIKVILFYQERELSAV